MKFLLFFASVLLTSCAPQPAFAAPTQAEIQRALQNAKTAWGIDLPVEIRMEPLNDCALPSRFQFEFPELSVEQVDAFIRSGHFSAIEEHLTTGSSITFEGQTTQSSAESATEVSATEVILLNANCHWTTVETPVRRFLLSHITETGVPLGATVLHEYGHALGIHWHSRDKRSIMYPIPSVDQVIMPEDRQKVSYGR